MNINTFLPPRFHTQTTPSTSITIPLPSCISLFTHRVSARSRNSNNQDSGGHPHHTCRNRNSPRSNHYLAFFNTTLEPAPLGNICKLTLKILIPTGPISEVKGRILKNGKAYRPWLGKEKKFDFENL